MTTQGSHHQSENNVWFGVAMILIGIIVGYVFAMASGHGIGLPAGNNPSAPAAPSSAPPAQAGETGQQKMTRIVASLGLDTNAFTTCLTSHKFAQKVADSSAAGSKAGVDGTPGNILYSMKTHTAWLISGARPLSSFQSAIDAMMKDPNGKPPDASITVVSNLLPVNVSTEHVRGNKNADIALVEYSDYQCPFCQRVHPTLQQMMQQYGDKVMWVYRQFPLPPTMHPDAQQFAEGSECVAEAGGNDVFWTYTDKMFE